MVKGVATLPKSRFLEIDRILLAIIIFNRCRIDSKTSNRSQVECDCHTVAGQPIACLTDNCRWTTVADVLFDLGIQLEEITKLWLLAMDSLTNSHDYRPVISCCRKCWPITWGQSSRSTMAKSAGTIEDGFGWPPW